MSARLEAMDALDACVFSSDMLFQEEERAEFKKFLARWQRAVAEHESAEGVEQPRPRTPLIPFRHGCRVCGTTTGPLFKYPQGYCCDGPDGVAF